MHFHFEKLGLLDRVDLELADLTLICGENNTGKTYATYAVYGFLRDWRSILRGLLEPEIDQLIKDTSEYRIDLMQMFEGKVNDYLVRMGKAYVRSLPRAFATDSGVFECDLQFVDVNSNSNSNLAAGIVVAEEDSQVIVVGILAVVEGNLSWVGEELDRTAKAVVACHSRVVEAFHIVVVEVGHRHLEVAFHKVVGVACRSLEVAFRNLEVEAVNQTYPSNNQS
jgi:hypothetical protein